MKKVKAYLFDLDGTLADSESYYCKLTYDRLKKYGYDGDLLEIKRETIGATREELISFIALKLGVSTYRAREILEEIYVTDEIDYSECADKDAYFVLKTLKERGYKLALCSANYRYNVDNFLKNGFEDIFDVALTCEEIKADSKPSPDVYTFALNKLGVRPKEAIVIEDSKNGVLAGKASGCHTIAYRRDRDSCKIPEADKTINSLIELIKL